MDIQSPSAHSETSGLHLPYLTTHTVIIHLRNLAASAADHTDNAPAPVCSLINHLVIYVRLPDQACFLKQYQIVINCDRYGLYRR